MMKKIILSITLFFTFTFICFSIISINDNNNKNDEEVIIKSEPTISEENIKPAAMATVEPEKITKETKTEIPGPTQKDIKPKKKKKLETIKPKIKTKEKDSIKLLMDKIKEAQKKRMAMKADILIETTYIDANNKQEVKGEMVIKKPDKFLVYYKEPTEQKLISDGKILWVYTPDLKQVIKQDLKEANLNTHFYIEFETSIDYFSRNSKNILTENETQYIIKMTPLKGKEIGFDEIISVIDKKNLTPESMTMKFENTKIAVKFFNMKSYNKNEILNREEFKDSVFEFKAPNDVEVIEATSLINVK